MKARLYIPIAFKLVFITGLLLLAAVAPITYQSTEKFGSISLDKEMDVNNSEAFARATEVEGLFVAAIDKIRVVAPLLVTNQDNQEQLKKSLQATFFQDRDLVSVEVISKGQKKPLRIANSDYFSKYGQTETYIQTLRDYQKNYNLFPIEAMFAGQIQIKNASIPGFVPLISIGVPLFYDEFQRVTHIAIAEIKLDRIQKVFGKEKDREVFMVDGDGVVLAHSNEKNVIERTSMIHLPIVEGSLHSAVALEQKKYQLEGTNDVYYGAAAKTSLGPIVIAQVLEDIVLEPAKKVRNESIQIAGRVLAVALFLVFLFSMTLTAPIERLVEVALQVAKGNFHIKTRVHSADEVGTLARTIDHMVVGLEERDKVKNALNTFHGSAVTEDILKGSLQLGGQRKKVTVFFSDIRDFTKFSEGHTPEEVVKMLNEYFKIMVGIITSHNGVVDKFIGDAIMAVWGIPNASEDDAVNAVKACMEMRKSLAELNQLRTSRGEVPIKIGMGVHSGSVISGNIGSDERMEYTVIGDAVNTASRIEASTKAFGADLLISGETVEKVFSSFMIEEAGKVEVKGKTEPLVLNRVNGIIDSSGNQIEIRTPWSHYEQGKDAKVKMVG